MAVIWDAFTLCQMFSDKNSVYVTPSENKGCVNVTHKSRCVDVLKVEDQKTTQRWSMRQAVTVTGPVVFSQTEGKYIAVQNKTELRLWTSDQHYLDKAKKRNVMFPVHRVFTLPNTEPIILCENGCIGVLSELTQITESKPYLDGRELLWCDAVKWQEELPVVMLLSKSKDDGKLTVNFCRQKTDGWGNTRVSLPISGQDVSYCCISTAQAVLIYALSRGGDLYCVSEQSGQVERLFSLPVEAGALMEAVGESHVAVAGVRKDSKVGLGIFDVKFGSLLAWKPYPKEKTSIKQLFVVENHLFVVCGQALYAYEFSCQPCTLASALGSFRDAAALTRGDNPDAVSLRWRVDSPQVVKKSSAEILALFDQLTNPSKTSTIDLFREPFNSLMEKLKKPDYQQFWTSQHMSDFIRRLSLEKKFWPREEILHVVKQGFVPPSVMSEFYEALIQHDDLLILHTSTSHLHDIPEAQVIQVLNYYLSCGDKDFTKISDQLIKKSSQHQSVDGVNCPFGPAKTQFINAVLALPYNDIFLLECLQNITFENVMILMQYLYFLLTTCTSVDGVTGKTPSLLQVVEWLCLLVDAHATQFILSPDARPVLVDLHQLVHQQLKFYDELVSLEAVLTQLKQCTPVKQQSVGLYCIEVLHIS